MKKGFLIICFCFCSLFTLTKQALAETKDYLVAPFNVVGSDEYDYLEKAVPGMLASRLFWSGKYETSKNQEALAKANPPADRSASEKLLKQYAADYIFTGNITVLGKEASIDMTAIGADGQVWQNASTTNVDNLITTLQSLADTFSRQMFNRSVARTGTAPVNENATVPLSGDFVINETGTNKVYLNPSFRYQGNTAGNRLKSQSLPFATVSMDAGDIDGSGDLDFIFAEDGRMLYLYNWNGGVMEKLAEYQLPSTHRTLAVRTFEQKGKTMIAVSAFSDNEARPLGVILEYSAGKLVPVVDRIPYYLNTVRIPGTTRDMLIAQSYDKSRVFRGQVFELYVGPDSYTKGPSVPNLPKEANVYNFTYLPDAEDSRGYKLAVLSKLEKLLVFSSNGSRMHETNDLYSGGNAFIRIGDDGLEISDDSLLNFYYIPMRMLSMDIDNDSQHELLANRPISTAATFFKNFRNYPQGEIHSMIWDGIGLSLLWKTKRISGTVADFLVADPNSDGIDDLITCVVTYPGALGLGERKTLITLYPLDTTLTDPNTPVSE